ncbi:MAG TPA: class I SAM-dependent methyltransferase [Gaiellales bacterium]
MHPTATAGFGNSADAYERGRPSYPDDAVAYLAAELGLGPATRILDLAAGTGKLTRLLVEGGAEVVAVEPVTAMRAALEQALPGVVALEGTAESIPLPAGSVDAVTVAQAFHWFDADAAIVEIHRVLRPGGGLGLIWNVMGSDTEWLAALRELVHGIRGSVPAYGVSPWQEAFRASSLFRPLTQRTFDLVHELDEDGLIDRIVSTSYVAALPDADRARLADQVRALVRDVPRPLRVPYRTDVFTYRGT